MNEDASTWRLSTAGGIPYKLVEGFPRGSFEEENAEVEERYIIRGSDLNDFVLESLTDTSMYPGGSWFYRPARSCPGQPWMVTQKVSFEPFVPGKPADPFGADADAPAGTYGEFVYVNISYKGGPNEGSGLPDPTNPEDNDLLEITCNATGEFLVWHPPAGSTYQVPASEVPSSVVGPDGVARAPTADDIKRLQQFQAPPATYPLTKIQPSLEWGVKFPRVPRNRLDTAINTARGMLGLVNTLEMPILNYAPCGTMLFMGFSMTYKRTWRDKQRFAQVDLKFLEKRINDGSGSVKGHNHFYNPKTGLWELILLPDGLYVYGGANLNLLFYG